MRNNRLTTRNQIRDTLVTLLMSVVLALVVWLFAMDQENPLIRDDFSTPIPISVRGLDPGLQTLQDLTQRTVSLNVRTSKRTWDSLAADDFSAVIDLGDEGPGSHDVDVIVSVVNPDIEILAQQPRQLRVQLESVITKTVPIVVDVVDSAALGYDWQTAIVDPEVAEVSGPEALVNQVQAVHAEVLLLGTKTQIERNATLLPRNGQGQAVDRVQVQPTAARVVVPVVQQPGRKEVAVLVQVDGQPAASYRITSVKPEPSTVILLGSAEALRNAPGFVETAPLSIEGATSDVRERLPLNLPENVSVLEEADDRPRRHRQPPPGCDRSERSPDGDGLPLPGGCSCQRPPAPAGCSGHVRCAGDARPDWSDARQPCGCAGCGYPRRHRGGRGDPPGHRSGHTAAAAA